MTLDHCPQSLPEDALGEASDSGGSAAEGHADLTFNRASGHSDLLLSEAVDEPDNQDSPISVEDVPRPISGQSLPVEPVGEVSDSSDEEETYGIGGRGRSDGASDVLLDGLPEVMVQPASSPVRRVEVPDPQFERLFSAPRHFDRMHESASPPPSSGGPTSLNTPSSGADPSLPPLSPLLGIYHPEELTQEDRETRLGVEDDLLRAFAEQAAISAEITGISAAESVAEEMQRIPLPSLPQYWNAYQYGLSLRAHQARGIWSRMSDLSERRRLQE